MDNNVFIIAIGAGTVVVIGALFIVWRELKK